MAKTRKKTAGETPHAYTKAHETAVAATASERVLGAAFEGPPTLEAARPGENKPADAWAPQATGDTRVADEDRDRIAARAYELYLERGGSGGDAMDDWLAAEREFSSGKGDERE